jgi:NAD(P)-dependent dehydrogenase (short-subunit alcohol dehydrogenase family)
VESFEGRIAVVTGGGTGMGRELVRQLAADGCHVAACDVQDDKLEATRELALGGAPDGTRVTAHHCDVADETEWLTFREETRSQHETDHIHLLFNNAGVGGGNSFVLSPREDWERTFSVCWNSTYLGCRTFLADLIAAPEAHIVNTSSVNGFWASLGPMPNHAYSSAKFAVKGFSEGLIADLRANAPHVKVSVVMPGHIGTDIVTNSIILSGAAPPDDAEAFGAGFRDSAPTSAATAATVILDGVRAGQWRILIGDDARALDELVREAPEDAYEPSLRERLEQRTPIVPLPD